MIKLQNYNILKIFKKLLLFNIFNNETLELLSIYSNQIEVD